MNLEEQRKSGVNQIVVNDSLDAPLLKLKLELSDSTVIPNSNELVISVDKNDCTSPSKDIRNYVFELSDVLKYFDNSSDIFELEIKPSNNDIVLEANILRKIGKNDNTFYKLDTLVIEKLESFPICLFKEKNYIYTNYQNVNIEVVYCKDCDMNKIFLNNAIYYNHKIKNNGDFGLDDIYFKDAFTKVGDKLNLEIDNVNISSLTSKNNKFNLDENGNLVVNSVTTVSGSLINFDSIYPIGSIYLTVSDVNPETLFGGSWEQIKDRFLLGAGEKYFNGSIGGEEKHTLTVEEIPSHSHNWNQTSCSSSGGHTHVVGADKDGGAGSNRYTVHITNNNTAYGQQYSPISGGAGEHTHSISGSNSNSGGNQSHNNMPPYFVVYIWKRVA